MLLENYELQALFVFSVFSVIGVFFILKRTKNKTRNISTLRLFVQIIALVAIFMGLLIGPFNLPLWQPLGISPRDHLIGTSFLSNQLPDGIPFPVLACYFPNGRTVTCPIWQLQAYVYPYWNPARGYEVFYSTSGLEKLAIVLGIVVVMSIVLGRFFCGWLCPFGLFMDVVSRIRKTFGKRHLSFSENTNVKLGQLRYIIIAVMLILSVIFGSYAIFGTQLIPNTVPGGPQGSESGIVSNINQPFCLICPMRPFCVLAECGLGFMSYNYVSQIVYGPFYITGFYVTSINLAILIVVIILSFAYRRFWCRLCPVGGLTALFSTFTPFKQIALTRLHKDENKCTKCGVCKRVCPTQVTEVYNKKGGDVTVSRCMLCFRCIEMCPEKDTLKFQFAGRTVIKSRNWLEE
ncbi:MAG TPA: 4Fe-4S binding protein [Candidatus Sulfotelmatobacter sp.]|nr:4Fe-4S binding protein [Candidatus Sulfotelmatobacter sp.]